MKFMFPFTKQQCQFGRAEFVRFLKHNLYLLIQVNYIFKKIQVNYNFMGGQQLTSPLRLYQSTLYILNTSKYLSTSTKENEKQMSIYFYRKENDRLTDHMVQLLHTHKNNIQKQKLFTKKENGLQSQRIYHISNEQMTCPGRQTTCLTCMSAPHSVSCTCRYLTNY